MTDEERRDIGKPGNGRRGDRVVVAVNDIEGLVDAGKIIDDGDRIATQVIGNRTMNRREYADPMARAPEGQSKIPRDDLGSGSPAQFDICDQNIQRSLWR